MGRLTLDQIAAVALDTREVHIDEWGGEVLIRALGYDEYQGARNQALTERGELDNVAFSKALLISGMVEPEVTADNVEAFLGRSAVAVDKLVGEILMLTSGVEGVTDAEATFPG